MSRIIELSEEIQKKARWLYCAAGKPVSREKLEESEGFEEEIFEDAFEYMEEE